MIMVAKGYKCSNVKCNSCIAHCMCGELGDAALDCVNRIITKYTNADRVRAMSDEELADVLREFATKPTQGSFLKWLKQPSEGE